MLQLPASPTALTLVSTAPQNNECPPAPRRRPAMRPCLLLAEADDAPMRLGLHVLADWLLAAFLGQGTTSKLGGKGDG